MEGIEKGHEGRSGDARRTRRTKIAQVTVPLTLLVGQTKKINPETDVTTRPKASFILPR